MDQDLSSTSGVAPEVSQPPEPITGANLPNHLSIYAPKGPVMLVFHYSPADDYTDKVPEQLFSHLELIMSFLVAIRGIFKYIPANRAPNSQKILVFIHDQQLGTAITMATPYGNEELQQVKPHQIACHLMNYYRLVPPVTLFDPAQNDLSTLTIQEHDVPPAVEHVAVPTLEEDDSDDSDDPDYVPSSEDESSDEDDEMLTGEDELSDEEDEDDEMLDDEEEVAEIITAIRKTCQIDEQ